MLYKRGKLHYNTNTISVLRNFIERQVYRMGQKLQCISSYKTKSGKVVRAHRRRTPKK